MLAEATISGADLGVQAWVFNGEEPSADRFNPISNKEYAWQKPDRACGLWTSTWLKEQGSGWIQWCLDEDFGGLDSKNPVADFWLLTPEPNAKVYRIDTYRDLEVLVDAYPAQSIIRDDVQHPDWAAIAEDFDAVNLTDAGQWATRLTHPLNLYGWDCESTLWLKFKFLAWHRLGEQKITYTGWNQDEDDE